MYSGYGGTEFGSPMKTWDETPGSLAPLEIDSEWNYKQVSKFVSVRWEPQGDGKFELIILVGSALCYYFRRLIFVCRCRKEMIMS